MNEPSRPDEPVLPTVPDIPPAQLELMHAIGFIHESEVEIITGTTKRTRARWQSPKGTAFGTEKYYRLADIKRHLEARLEDAGDDRGDDLVARSL
jgi:hypothetical protein